MTVAQAILHPYLYENPQPIRPQQIECLSKFDHYQKIITKNWKARMLKKRAVPNKK
jgi:hypothetical protein